MSTTQCNILVFGATGRVGGEIVRQLLDSGVPVAAAVRNPDKARTVLPTSSWLLKLVTADLSDAESVYKAATETGAQRVFLYVMHRGDMDATIQSLRRAGVKHIVLLSSFSVQPKFLQANNAIARVHAVAEEAIKRYSDITYTFVRGGAFASNAINFWKHPIRAGAISLHQPDDVINSMVAEEDMAAIAVRALTTSELDNQAVPARGLAMLSQREQIETISRVIGKPIAVKSISEEELRQQMLNLGFPAPMIDAITQLNADPAEDKEGALEETVRALGGREPMSFVSYVEKHHQELVA